MAAELFAASLLEICPSLLLVATKVTPLGFFCDVVSPFPLTKDYISLAEARVKEKIKNPPSTRLIEMTSRNAKDLLLHHKQKIRAELLDFEEPLVHVITIGEYVNVVFEKPFLDLGELGVVSIEETIGVGELIYQKKPREITRLSGVVFDTKEDLKEFRKQTKEALKYDHIKNGQDWNLFTIYQEGIFFKKEGVLLREIIDEKITNILSNCGFEKVEFLGDVKVPYSRFFTTKVEETGGEGEYGLKNAPITKIILVYLGPLIKTLEEISLVFRLNTRVENFSKGEVLSVLWGKDRRGIEWEIASVEKEKGADKSHFYTKIYVDRIFALILEQFLEKELLKNSLL